MNDEMSLDETFRRYREACPDVTPSANFMPTLWTKIENRQNFWSLFERFGSRFATATAALCLLLLALNFISAPSLNSAPSYVDALMADHSAEKTYYAEAIRNAPAGDTDNQPNR
jgi:hypothetical protein